MLRATLFVAIVVVALAGCAQDEVVHEPVTTHEPVTHRFDSIRPEIDTVVVAPLPIVTDRQQPDGAKTSVLSEGLELVLLDDSVAEEPRVVSEAHQGTYVLVNATDRAWAGTLLCLRNHEQVACGGIADVWAVALKPAESTELKVSFRPVGPSGQGDHIQLVPIAATGSRHIGRIGGVYSAEAPDTFGESTSVTPNNAVSESTDCDTTVVEGTTLVVRVCVARDSVFRVLAFSDGTTLTPGSTRVPNQPDLYRLVGVGEFRIDIGRQLEDSGSRPAVVLMWEGTTGQVPEVWIAPA